MEINFKIFVLLQLIRIEFYQKNQCQINFHPLHQLFYVHMHTHVVIRIPVKLCTELLYQGTEVCSTAVYQEFYQ